MESDGEGDEERMKMDDETEDDKILNSFLLVHRNSFKSYSDSVNFLVVDLKQPEHVMSNTDSKAMQSMKPRAKQEPRKVEEN